MTKGMRACLAFLVAFLIAGGVDAVTGGAWVGWAFGIPAGLLIWFLVPVRQVEPPTTGDPIWDAAGRKTHRRGQR